jgi:hypothetical protein
MHDGQQMLPNELKAGVPGADLKQNQNNYQIEYFLGGSA